MVLKILVVDDEADVPLMIQQRFRSQIRENHINFRFAGNGVEALQALDKEPDIDIVLSDINMPQMDGLTLLAELAGRGPTPKTVMVSAYGDLDNIRTAMNRGAFDFVTKPIDFRDLQTTIDKTQRELVQIKQALKTRDELVGVRRELQLAATIQRSLLPQEVPANGAGGRFDLFADMVPATEVAGDFYDYFMIDDHRMGFLVADVSGKGIPAALYMAVARTLLRAASHHESSPGACLTYLNQALVKQDASGMFVTMFYGILNTQTGVVEYSNGGHNPPYVLGPEGICALRDRCGPMLGVFPGSRYLTKTTELQAGHVLFAYTDGVTEAANPRGEFYEDARLEAYLNANKSQPVEKLVGGLRADVARFESGAPRADDITVLALAYVGPERSS